jgi:hypothetical protein
MAKLRTICPTWMWWFQKRCLYSMASAIQNFPTFLMLQDTFQLCHLVFPKATVGSTIPAWWKSFPFYSELAVFSFQFSLVLFLFFIIILYCSKPHDSFSHWPLSIVTHSSLLVTALPLKSLSQFLAIFQSFSKLLPLFFIDYCLQVKSARFSFVWAYFYCDWSSWTSLFYMLASFSVPNSKSNTFAFLLPLPFGASTTSSSSSTAQKTERRWEIEDGRERRRCSVRHSVNSIAIEQR